MQKKIYINDFISSDDENREITSQFLVIKKILGVTQNQKPYLNLRLKDRSGELDARVWERAEEFSQLFEQGDVITVEAKVVLYQGAHQLKVFNLERPDQDEIDWTHFLPKTSRNPGDMVARINEIINGMESGPLQRLLRKFLKDEEFIAADYETIAQAIRVMKPEAKTSSKSIASYVSKKREEWELPMRVRVTKQRAPKEEETAEATE